MLRLEFEAKYRTDLKPSEQRWKKTGRIFQKALDDPLNKLIVGTFSRTRGMEAGISGAISGNMYKRLCNAGFSVTSLDGLKTLLHDWLLIDRLGVQLWDIMQDIQTRQEEIEKKWDEEVDAPKREARRAKNGSKQTGQKKADVRKPRGPPVLLNNTTSSSRQHPVTDPRLLTPAILRSNVPTLPLLDRHLMAQRHGITPDATPTAMTSQLLTPDPSFRSGTSLPPPTSWTHPLCGNMIQPPDNHYYLGSPVQVGRSYTGNGRNPLQEFDPNLQSFMQGFVRDHQDQ